jgi:hypothetical protein
MRSLRGRRSSAATRAAMTGRCLAPGSATFSLNPSPVSLPVMPHPNPIRHGILLSFELGLARNRPPSGEIIRGRLPHRLPMIPAQGLVMLARRRPVAALDPAGPAAGRLPCATPQAAV